MANMEGLIRGLTKRVRRLGSEVALADDPTPMEDLLERTKVQLATAQSASEGNEQEAFEAGRKFLRDTREEYRQLCPQQNGGLGGEQAVTPDGIESAEEV